MKEIHQDGAVFLPEGLKVRIHLQMSLGGEYKMKQKKAWRSRRNRLNFDEIPFYNLYKLAYQHAENLVGSIWDMCDICDYFPPFRII